LTDADAIPDGIASARALQTQLCAIYRRQLARPHQTNRIIVHRLTEYRPDDRGAPCGANAVVGPHSVGEHLMQRSGQLHGMPQYL
jgi:hypothetical protein